ncbi:DUF4349 domain-containing protein [Sporosarcina sp. FA9]|uniref:DUF4349 domain-containing protein n=1 Tax=Sporosarcina sp. FA9 TaxID=3413030 RepID=UPI003F659596
MRKAIFILLLSSLFVLMASCSSDRAKDDVQMESSKSSNDMAMDKKEKSLSEEESADVESEVAPTNRMIIHRAELQINVKNLENALLTIEKKVSEYGGYIVESNVFRENEERVSGKITVRIPEKHFQSFLSDAEGEAADIPKRYVTGDDITEQYIDLESRVKSKRAVEERLLEFMGNAEKTEDLLKISSDLAKIQEEIELIVGKMKYFENQTSFSTVEISMFENRIIVPGLESKNLDTWEKTKKQLATSTNFILATGSGLIVFFIGNLPVLIFLLFVGLGIYFIIRRKIKPK